MILQIEDNVSPMLEELIKIAPDGANEALGKAGNVVRNEIMRSARSQGRANTGFSFVNGKRKLTSSKQGGSKQLFSRYGHDTGNKLDVDMAEFVRFRVYDKTHKVLVGFMNTKSWRPIKYRDGRSVGFWARKKGTYAKDIGRLYEFGGQVKLTKKQKKFFKASGWHRAARKGYVDRKAYHVVAKGWSSSRGLAVSKFENEFNEIVKSIGLTA